MKTTWRKWLLAGCLGLAGCAAPAPTPDAAATAVMQTVDAVNTRAAALQQTLEALTPTPPPPTATLAPTRPPQSPPTPIPTLPVQPTSTPTLDPAFATEPCHRAGLVKDVTVPDGTRINAGMRFVKVWRFINKGSCTWTPDYRFVNVGGDPMSGARQLSIGKSVAPGETLDLEMTFFATIEKGKHVGYYLFESPQGERFGYGASGDGQFYIYIISDPYGDPGTNRAFDFTQYPCEARWFNAETGDLPCPLKAEAARGYFYVQKDAVIEGATKRKGFQTLVMVPPVEQGAFIAARYRPFRVKAGDKFVAELACLNNHDQCKVLFQFDVIDEKGEVHTLYGPQLHVYDEYFPEISLELAQFAGQKVEFLLTVTNQGGGDDGFFGVVQPYIWR